MAKRATVTEADMRRAIKAATECGLQVDECVMKPSEIRPVFSNSEENPKKGYSATIRVRGANHHGN
jgi:hypothetical protein